MTSLENMKRHLGKLEEFDLGDGEKVLIAPIPAEFLPEYLVAQTGLANGKVDKVNIQLLTKCIVESLKVANPKGTMPDAEYESLLNDFASQYYFKLLEKIGEINTGGITDSDIDKMEKIQKKMNKGNGPRVETNSGKE